MNKIQNVEKQLQTLNILVVDDEISEDQDTRKDFIDDLGFKNINVTFAANCEDATNIVSKKNNEIHLGFLDCKLPKSKKDSIEYNPSRSLDYGIQFANEIAKKNIKLPFIVFSAYVDETILESTANNSSNIVGYLSKNEPPEAYRDAIQIGLKHSKLEEFELQNVEEVGLQNSSLYKSDTGFDYLSLPEEDRKIIKDKTDIIYQLGRETAYRILKIGENVIDIRSRLPKGSFHAWVESEFPYSIAMAYRFIKVFEHFGDLPREELDLLPVTVLYELAVKSIDENAIKETIEMAKMGETITVAKAKEIKNKYSKPTKDTKKSIVSNYQSSLKSSLETEEEESDKSESFVSKMPTIIQEQEEITINSELIPSTSEKGSLSTNLKQKIVKFLPKKRLWNIDNHIIFNGNPNSSDFLNLLPPKALICLNFSDDPNFRFLYNNYNSWLSLHINNPDTDYKKLVNLLNETLANSTENLDAVIVLFIPHKDILNIIHDWYCKAYVVDPNYQKCLEVVN